MNWLKDLGIVEENFKWIYLVLLIAFTVMAFYPLQRALRGLKAKLPVKPTHTFSLQLLELKLERPLVALILSVFWHSFFGLMDFAPGFEKGMGLLIQIVQSIYLVQIAYQICDAVGLWLEKNYDAGETTMHQQLVPLIRKSLKILVVVLGTLIVIQGLGFNVISLLAGLGLGGLALALAAQDTAANVFGSIMILLDKPFKVGDLVKIADTEGVVEDIGFRSTRLRTPYRSLVTVPNSTVAKEKIDNLSERDMLRVRHTLGITYSATPEKVQSFADEIRHELTLNPSVFQEDIIVYLQNMGDFSLQIVVQFFVKTLSPQELGKFQQDFLLQVMRLAQKNQVEFAFPTQTLHVESLPKALS